MIGVLLRQALQLFGLDVAEAGRDGLACRLVHRPQVQELVVGVTLLVAEHAVVKVIGSEHRAHQKVLLQITTFLDGKRIGRGSRRLGEPAMQRVSFFLRRVVLVGHGVVVHFDVAALTQYRAAARAVHCEAGSVNVPSALGDVELLRGPHLAFEGPVVFHQPLTGELALQGRATLLSDGQRFLSVDDGDVWLPTEHIGEPIKSHSGLPRPTRKSSLALVAVLQEVEEQFVDRLPREEVTREVVEHEGVDVAVLDQEVTIDFRAIGGPVRLDVRQDRVYELLLLRRYLGCCPHARSPVAFVQSLEPQWLPARDSSA